ncbi:4-hydroxy-tetrahydrodipicolinate synthase [Sporomusa aerivorans]|uniref:4-hydroxy-tetrahydrodipicolinate synthase n=1 Tax=Sporomusa aerivorans TaxID=204936 RepID=UPI00352A62D3
MDIGFIKGIVVPVVTPVDERDRVVEEAYRQIVEHVVAGGVHGVFALGSNGEFYGLDVTEQLRAVEIAVDQVRGRVPVYAGIGAISTNACVKLAKKFEQLGVQAITVLPPMFISPSEEELYSHFRSIAEATALPVLLYNNPDRVKANLSPGLMERLADIPNIAGVKDSSGDLTLTSEYIRRNQGKNFVVLAGRDTLILGTLFYGGVGAVAATANIAPKLVVSIYDHFMAKDYQQALAAQYQLAPLRIAFGLGSWPVVTKEAANLIGLPAGEGIKPITGCSPENKQKLQAILRDMGLLA